MSFAETLDAAKRVAMGLILASSLPAAIWARSVREAHWQSP